MFSLANHHLIMDNFLKREATGNFFRIVIDYNASCSQHATVLKEKEN